MSSFCEDRIVRLIKIVVCSVAVFVISGCGAPMLQVVRPPAVDSATSASVTIMRNPAVVIAGSGANQWAIYDGKPVTRLERGQFTVFNVTPGKHKIGVRCFYPMSLPEPGKVDDGYDQIEIDVTPNSKICIQTSITFFSCSKIEVIDNSNCPTSNQSPAYVEPGTVPR